MKANDLIAKYDNLCVLEERGLIPQSDVTVSLEAMLNEFFAPDLAALAAEGEAK